jgi:hypothetical protein
VLAAVKFKVMGVMSCSRNGCESIMCDTYVDSIGYVCRYCQDEFKEYLKKENIQANTEGEIKRALETFMSTYKGRYEKGSEMSVDDFF